jgi:hypothetical protein
LDTLGFSVDGLRRAIESPSALAIVIIIVIDAVVGHVENRR